MREVYRQFLKGLSRDEAVEVRDVLNVLLAGGDPFATDVSTSPSCPHCGCAFVVRKGFDRMGAQRWQCTACRRTFGLKACCMRSKTAPFGGSDCDAA